MKTDYSLHREALLTQGFSVINGIYSQAEIVDIGRVIGDADQSKDTFRKTADLFAIRKCLNEIPQLLPLVFNLKLREVAVMLFGSDYFVSKSIYFDKPKQSNWFVAWHRDLTISVNKKVSLPAFSNWTVKNNQYAVQPPLEVLKENFTIRIHLDSTNADNGALKVIPGSHLDRDIQHDTSFNLKDEFVCDVEAGGIMIMRPLLLHASNRTVSDKQRRVLHIEFSKATLPNEIEWSEKITISN